MKATCLWVLSGLLVLTQAVTAPAYILPAEQILTLMIDKFAPADTLLVSQKTVLYDPALKKGFRQFDETLYYRYPDRFRSEVKTRGLKRIQVVNEDDAVIIIDGKIVAETEPPFDHFKDLFLFRKTRLLVDRLSRMGVNCQVVSLGRFNDKVVYVIGAKYPDDSVPQVWIDKTTLRPVGLILGDNSGALPLSRIEYQDYHTEPDQGGGYPRRILFFKKGSLVKMHVLDTVQVNAPVPDQLFDVAYLKSITETVAPAPPAFSPASELDEVKEGIESFKRAFE
ncbi:MAG: hypothetical protein SWE60_14980 [Thermodesulfobacteriota bacterium]|nr:hypothetical protein [Thermodesulfobacteriota bacterium]